MSEGMGAAGKPKQKLALLHDFARLYQHPALLRSSGDELSSEAVEARQFQAAPRIVELLHQVEAAGEKALIFRPPQRCATNARQGSGRGVPHSRADTERRYPHGRPVPQRRCPHPPTHARRVQRTARLSE